MTKKCSEILTFIIQFKKVNQFSPTVREIANGCYTSISYVKEVLEILKDEGYITYIEKKPRTIVVKKFK